MTLESSKSLGGIGAILLFIGVLPFVQYLWVIGLVGIILILVALNGLANYYSERGIFNNALYGVITAVVGVIVAVGAAVAALLANLSNISDFISAIYPGWNGDWTSLSGMTPNTSNLNPMDLLPLIGGIVATVIVVLVVLWVFAIVSAFFVRRSLKQVTDKSKVGLFGTSGLLLLIGAFLVIAFGFGLILMWIAALLLAIAFFTLRPSEQPMQTAPPPPPPPTPV
jgi:uncharacterized membrane protein